MVSLLAGVMEVPSGMATMAPHLFPPRVPDQIEAIDLSALSTEERDEGKVSSL